MGSRSMHMQSAMNITRRGCNQDKVKTGRLVIAWRWVMVGKV